MSYEDRPGMPSYDLLLGENTTMLVEINRLEAESATKDEVIRRLLDGWRVGRTYPRERMYWRKPERALPGRYLNENMSDAHRAVLENLP